MHFLQLCPHLPLLACRQLHLPHDVFLAFQEGTEQSLFQKTFAWLLRYLYALPAIFCGLGLSFHATGFQKILLQCGARTFPSKMLYVVRASTLDAAQQFRIFRNCAQIVQKVFPVSRWA